MLAWVGFCLFQANSWCTLVRLKANIQHRLWVDKWYKWKAVKQLIDWSVFNTESCSNQTSVNKISKQPQEYCWELIRACSVWLTADVMQTECKDKELEQLWLSSSQTHLLIIQTGVPLITLLLASQMSQSHSDLQAAACFTCFTCQTAALT